MCYLIARIQISGIIAEKFMKLLNLRIVLVITLVYNSMNCKSDGSMPKIFGSIPLSNSVNVPARFVVSPTSSLNTSESGTSVQISISLNKAPTADVSVNTITFSDPLEGTLNKNSLTFTSSNWNTAQVLTITGVDDLFVDGDKNSILTFSTSTSTDLEFKGLTIDNLTITNKDNDVPNIITVSSSGLITSETGTSRNFSVQLTSQPTSTVTIPSITSSNTAEGTVSPTTLTFTTTNWNTPQVVTVTGVDDALDDGSQTYLVQFSAATSSDTVYNGKAPDPVSMINTDNETFGVTASVISGATTEAGGTATFNVVLNSASTSSVTIPIASSNIAEGTVSPSSLTFTPGNWNVPQIVTVTGVDDFVQDGNIAYTINLGPCSSSNSNYEGLVPTGVSVTNNDNDTANYNITPSSATLMVSDGGQLSSNFTISLASQPTADVTIPISSTLPGEVTLSTSSVTFTAGNWNTLQTVTLTGVSDGLGDGNQSFTINLGLPTTTDTVYAALDPADQTGGSCDNDLGVQKIVACRATNNPSTDEAGATAQYYLILSQLPTANVTVGVSSSDTTQGTVSPASIVMTAVNWNQFTGTNLITVTGANDALYDGDVTFNINFAAAVSTDGFFSGYNLTPSIPVLNIDNEVYFTVSAVTGSPINETGTTATYNIVLPAAPTANVTFTLSSSDTTEGTVSPTNITFTTGNWNTPQLITITGVNDSIADGNIAFTIDSTVATSTDLRFNGKTPASVNVTTNDAGEKITYITSVQYNGNLGNKAGADAICAADPNKPTITPNSFKAFIVNGSSRIASTTANTGAGQVDWVLGINTQYFQSDGTTSIFTSDANKIFVFGTLTNSFGLAGNNYWTGLNSNWTTATTHCTSWTSTALTGADASSSSTGGASVNNGTNACSSVTRRLLCIQQ